MNDETFLWLIHHKELTQACVALLWIGALVAGWFWGRHVERAQWHRTIRAAVACGPKVQDSGLIRVVESAGVTISDKAPDAGCVTTPDGGCIGGPCMHDPKVPS